jgi:hypothetical protein
MGQTQRRTYCLGANRGEKGQIGEFTLHNLVGTKEFGYRIPETVPKADISALRRCLPVLPKL